MCKAILICGFNNWGKSTVIRELTNCKSFYNTSKYVIGINNQNFEFLVKQQSNDDLIGEDWIELLEKLFKINNTGVKNLLSSICPSKEDKNDFVELLNNKFFDKFSEVHLILLKYKWEMNAMLIPENIIKYIGNNPKIITHLIEELPNSENYNESIKENIINIMSVKTT